MWTNEFLQYLKQSTLAESYFEKAVALKQQHLPKRIYKYRSDTPYARKNLESSTIWLASPESYNDPYDCFLRFSGSSTVSAFERGFIDAFITGYELDISLEKIEEAKQSPTPLQTLIQNISNEGKPGAKHMAEVLSNFAPACIDTMLGFLQLLRKVAKICSFSAINDSILMWSHYACDHKGFCIEYDLQKFDPDDPFLRNLYPIIYSHELFDLTPWAEKIVSGKAADLTTVFPLLGVLQKFEGWEYEREWRYVSFKETVTLDRDRSMPTPSRVFIGANAQPSNELLTICEERTLPYGR